jgi:hypothetical protein
MVDGGVSWIRTRGHLHASPMLYHYPDRHDACFPAGGHAVGRTPMDEVLEISLREEEVHKKLQEIENAVAQLQTLLHKTQAQLNKRQAMKRKVLPTRSLSCTMYQYHVSELDINLLNH